MFFNNQILYLALKFSFEIQIVIKLIKVHEEFMTSFTRIEKINHFYHNLNKNRVF